MKKENRLPINKWVEIIKDYGKGKEYFFFGISADKNRYDRLENQLNNYNITRFDGKLSLMSSIKALSEMDLVLSEDGGTYHMAVCAGIPSITYWLHGKDNMDKWKAPFKKHKAVMVG